MRCVIFLLVATQTLGYAPSTVLKKSQSNDADVDMKALQGRWVAVLCSGNGEKLHDDPDIEANQDLYTGSRLVSFVSGEELSSVKVTLNAASKPRRMIQDLIHSEIKNRTVFIYRLEGDTLTLARLQSQEKSQLNCPSDFQPRKGVLIVVYKRKKPS